MWTEQRRKDGINSDMNAQDLTIIESLLTDRQAVLFESSPMPDERIYYYALRELERQGRIVAEEEGPVFVFRVAA